MHMPIEVLPNALRAGLCHFVALFPRPTLPGIRRQRRKCLVQRLLAGLGLLRPQSVRLSNGEGERGEYVRFDCAERSLCVCVASCVCISESMNCHETRLTEQRAELVASDRRRHLQTASRLFSTGLSSGRSAMKMMPRSNRSLRAQETAAINDTLRTERGRRGTYERAVELKSSKIKGRSPADRVKGVPRSAGRAAASRGAGGR